MHTETATRQAGLRKAAIVVSSLDRGAAEALLRELSVEQVERLRAALRALGEVPAEEREEVLREFRRQAPRPPAAAPPGIELSDRLAQRFSRAAETLSQRQEAGGGRSPFDTLRDAEADHLARVLAAERPQIVAAVLSHLPPRQSGQVLVRLSPRLQVEVVRRLVDLEETDPEVLGEVERGLAERLARQVPMQPGRVAGLAAVSGILEASGQQVAVQILDNLTHYDAPLASRLGPAEVDFADLADLDGQTLACIFAAADPEEMALALVGAPPQLVERLLERIPFEQGRDVRHQLEHLGPTRLSDVEEARRRIAEVARKLAAAGAIALPRRFYRPEISTAA